MHWRAGFLICETQELFFFWVEPGNLGAGDCDISMMAELEAFLDLCHPPAETDVIILKQVHIEGRLRCPSDTKV